MPASKQSKSSSLSSGQKLFDDRRLTAAFLGMAAALKSRPEPRAAWDNIAAGRAMYKGHEAVACAKDVLRAAIITGDHRTIEQVAAAIAHFFEELKHVALRDYCAIANGDISLDDAVLKASKETGEALHAILGMSLEITDRQLTVKEIDEAIQALADLRAKIEAPAPSPVTIRRGLLALS